MSASHTRVVHLLLLMTLQWYHSHPKSIVYIRVASWWCTFFGFDKCTMTGIHHVRSIFTALTVLWSAIYPSHPLAYVAFLYFAHLLTGSLSDQKLINCPLQNVFSSWFNFFVKPTHSGARQSRFRILPAAHCLHNPGQVMKPLVSLSSSVKWGHDNPCLTVTVRVKWISTESYWMPSKYLLN